MADQRFRKFLEPLKDLAQNWNIDVAKDLEEYLHELEGLTVTFGANGASNLNFAEAALLIQGSAVVYSKKVEYLYSLIYHALDVLSAKSACVCAAVLLCALPPSTLPCLSRAPSPLTPPPLCLPRRCCQKGRQEGRRCSQRGPRRRGPAGQVCRGRG